MVHKTASVVVARSSRNAFNSIVSNVASIHVKCLNLLMACDANLSDMAANLWINEINLSDKVVAQAKVVSAPITNPNAVSCGTSPLSILTQPTAATADTKADTDVSSLHLTIASDTESVASQDFWGFADDYDDDDDGADTASKVLRSPSQMNVSAVSLPVSVPAELEEVDHKPMFLLGSLSVDGRKTKGVRKAKKPTACNTSKLTVGDTSQLRVSNNSKPTVGDNSKPTAGDNSKPTVGDKSKPTVGDKSKPTLVGVSKKTAGKATKQHFLKTPSFPKEKTKSSEKVKRSQSNGSQSKVQQATVQQATVQQATVQQATVQQATVQQGSFGQASSEMVLCSAIAKGKANVPWLKRPYRPHDNATSLWLSSPVGGKKNLPRVKKSKKKVDKPNKDTTTMLSGQPKAPTKAKKVFDALGKITQKKSKSHNAEESRKLEPSKSTSSTKPKSSHQPKGGAVESNGKESGVKDFTTPTESLSNLPTSGSGQDQCTKHITNLSQTPAADRKVSVNSGSHSHSKSVSYTVNKKKFTRIRKKRSPRTACLSGGNNSKVSKADQKTNANAHENLSPALYLQNTQLASTFERKSKLDAMKSMRHQLLFTEDIESLPTLASSYNIQSTSGRSGYNTALSNGIDNSVSYTLHDVYNFPDSGAEEESNAHRHRSYKDICSNGICTKTNGTKDLVAAAAGDTCDDFKQNFTNHNNMADSMSNCTLSSRGTVHFPPYTPSDGGSDSDGESAVNGTIRTMLLLNREEQSANAIPAPIVGYTNGVEYRFQPVIDGNHSRFSPVLENRGYFIFKSQYIPYIVMNGFKYIQVSEATKLFPRCGRRCTLPKRVLLQKQAMLSHLTFEQVTLLDKVKCDNCASANTGDPVIRCTSVLDHLADIENELEKLHTAGKGKNCTYVPSNSSKLN